MVALDHAIPTRTPDPNASTQPLENLWLQPTMKKPTVEPTATAAVSLSVDGPQEGNPVEVFRVGNDLEVFNGGTPTQFTLARVTYVTELFTYHWNGGAGAAAGTIAVQSGDHTYGPWQASLVSGVYWRVTPNQTLPSGAYTIIDSAPATWAQNAATGGQGMAWMMGTPQP